MRLAQGSQAFYGAGTQRGGLYLARTERHRALQRVPDLEQRGRLMSLRLPKHGRPAGVPHLLLGLGPVYVGPGEVYFRIPFWLLTAAFLASPMIAYVQHRKRRKRRTQGLCPACGYDVRATPTVCPECGAEILPSIGGTSVIHAAS